MLPELIYREGKQDNYKLLFALGVISGLTGFKLAQLVFPGNVPILAVVFAAIPLVYPLTRTFLEDEEQGRPHIDEILIYGSLFAGEVFAFFILALTVSPDNFTIQIAQFETELRQMGITSLESISLDNLLTGYATSTVNFVNILLNNLLVFSLIFAISAIVSSSAAFILVWNGSVLGIFLGTLVRKLSGVDILTGTENIAPPIAYLPHTFFEMTGFIIAGISGSLISAALYREHFDKKTWKDYAKLFALGLLMILVGAFLETT